uniref:ZIP family transporter n=1 Tax=Physcomitrium patens TaxID=3218 RepID=A0A7I4DZW5_PHYPA
MCSLRLGEKRQKRMFERSSGLLVPSRNSTPNYLKLSTDMWAGDVIKMVEINCGPTAADDCHDKVASTHLKVVAIAVILSTSALGVLIPFFGRRSRLFRTDGNPFMVVKAFAAGVILATAFVHMLPAAHRVLSNPCLPEDPWGKFAWAGFITMLAALGTLVMDSAATEFYMNRPEHHHGHHHDSAKIEDSEHKNDVEKQPSCAVITHPHTHEDVNDDGHFTNIRHVVVAQVFEFGIVAHSIIIGITVGVSNSPCTIKPLFAALTFHQFFEGFALGGCVAQAEFSNLSTLIMGIFFAITTPLGIGTGMGALATYNPNSAKALIIQGVFDSISGGILVYMALVDLIAADFLSKRMRSSRRLQIASFVALFCGAGCMSLVGIWA